MSPPAVPMSATILAAGLGRRMGHRPKAALEIGGSSLLERLINALRAAGLHHVSVVIGPHAETLLPIVKRCRAQALQHGRSDTHLIESQRLALQNHVDQGDGHDLLIVLADLPRLNSTHLQPLIEAWPQRPDAIHAQMPVVEGVRGHPLILSWHAVQQVLATPSHLGIRDWLVQHPDLVLAIPTVQQAHIADLDTPSDVAALQAHCHPTIVSWPAPWDH